jgi:hypothetical protein
MAVNLFEISEISKGACRGGTDRGVENAQLPEMQTGQFAAGVKTGAAERTAPAARDQGMVGSKLSLNSWGQRTMR